MKHIKKFNLNEDLKSDINGITEIIDRVDELSIYDNLILKWGDSRAAMQSNLEEINNLINKLRFLCT